MFSIIQGKRMQWRKLNVIQNNLLENTLKFIRIEKKMLALLFTLMLCTAYSEQNCHSFSLSYPILTHSILQPTACLCVHSIYQDRKLLAPVTCFAQLDKTSLWTLWAEQHASYTRFLPRPTRKEFNLPKLPTAEILSGKNAQAFLVCGFLMKSFKKNILKI